MTRLIALMTALVIQVAYCEIRRLRKEQRESLNKDERIELEEVRRELSEMVEALKEQRNQVWQDNRNADKINYGGTD